MKSITILLISLLATTAFSQPFNEKVLKIEKVYISIKKDYKQVRISPLPMKHGKVDAKTMILVSSKKRNVLNLGVNKAQRRQLTEVITLLKRKNTLGAKRKWKNFVNSLKDGNAPMNLNSIIQYVLRQSYLETNKDLVYLADKVRHFKEVKQTIREHTQDMREFKAECSKPGSNCSATTTQDLEYSIEKWEENLQKIGDDAQLANIDLQNMLQKQQQTIQMMSIISKMLHDTAMAVIRKIG